MPEIRGLTATAKKNAELCRFPRRSSPTEICRSRLTFMPREGWQQPRRWRPHPKPLLASGPLIPIVGRGSDRYRPTDARYAGPHSMKNLLVSLAACALIIGFSTGCGVASGSSSLELNPGAGTTTRFEMKLRQEISQTIMGREMDQDQTTQFGFTQTMGEPKADGTITIGVVYDWVSTDVGVAALEERVTFDSRDDDGEATALTAGMRALVGKGFSLEVTAQGEILAVGGVAEMFDAMFAELDQDEDVAVVRDALKKMLGDDALKDSMQPFLSIYPDRDVAVGDTWRRRHQVSGGFPHVQDNVYELLERSQGSCQVRLESRLSTPKDAAPMDMGMIKIRLSLAGTQEGTLKLDESTGLVLESQLESDFSGTMEIVSEATQDLDEQMKPWPITLHQELTLRAVD